MYGGTHSNGFEFVKICPQIFMNLVNLIEESEIYNGIGKDPLNQAKNFIIQATDIYKYFRTSRSISNKGGWLNELGYLDLPTHTSPSPIRRVFAPGFVNYKTDVLDSQPQVIKFTSPWSVVLSGYSGFLHH